MDTTSVLAKTAKGLAAKPESEGLNYDAVRLLRVIDGKASIGELRLHFEDLTEGRFQKAIAMLQHKGLVHALDANQPPGNRTGVPALDAGIREVEQEFLQSLDFTTLQRTLLDAMRSSPPQADATAPTTPTGQPAAAQAASGAGAGPQPEAKARPAQKTRPTQQAEMRAQLMAALRPKVENELRATLASALRPALEAEIRSKLTSALRPRVELELRARLIDETARAAAAAAAPQQRLLDCLQEAVFQNDLAGKNVYLNPASARLTEASARDAIGRPFAELFIAGDQRGVALFLDRVARGRETPPWFEASLARKSGGPLRIEVRAAPLTAASGDTIGVCGSLRCVGAAQERGN